MTFGTANAWWRCAGVAALVAVVACVDNGDGRTTTETHWLGPCTTDVDCGDPYRCLCELCMLPCDSAAFCTSQIVSADVLPPNDPTTLVCLDLDDPSLTAACVLDTGNQPDVCLPPCDDAADCAGYGGEDDDVICVDGVCINDRRSGSAGADVGWDLPPLGSDENNAPVEAVDVLLTEASTEWLWLSSIEMPFLPSATSLEGRLDPGENPPNEFDRDYYRFSVTESTWVAIVTAANIAQVGLIDTVVALYDGEGSLLATNNDAVGARSAWGWHFDSELVAQLSPGSYLVEVSDLADWGGYSYTNEPGDYRLGVGRMRPGIDSVLFETEAGDDEASALEIPSERGAWLLLGTLDGPDDRDVFRVPRTPRSVVAARMTPPGDDGQGGPPTRMWLTEEGDPTPIALVDGGRDELVFPAGPGSYLLWVARDGEPTTALAHYVIKHERTSEDAVLEADDAANDTPAGAQPIPDTGTFTLWLGDGDVDYWSFESMARIDCCAWRDGSGVLDLRIEVRDADDAILDESVPEGPNGPASILGTISGVDSPGTYYLRFTKGSQDPLVTGNFVRCWVE